MSAQTAADLRAAANVLRRDGWTQGRLWDPNGCPCVVGSLLVAINGDRTDVVTETEHRRYEAAWDALLQHIGYGPSIYNDEPGRTQDEVIAALEAAADTAEQA